ncbi:MAG: GNAT family N-acetyltransferase [Hyphomicrobiaceae bacterium]
MDVDVAIDITAGLAAAEVASVLESLPDWFGRPEAITAYTREAGCLSVVTARRTGDVLGFLTMKPRTPAACEIAVMAVRPEWRRHGIGRALCQRAFQHMRAGGFSLAFVQTVGPSYDDAPYAETRRFYAAVGFLPLIELADHFGCGVPGLLMVRGLTPPA